MSDKMSTDRRFRKFACVVYKRSAPVRWKSIISDLCFNALISPLHESEHIPAHWHVLVVFSKARDLDYLYSVMNSFGGIMFQPISDDISFSKYIGGGTWIHG